MISKSTLVLIAAIAVSIASPALAQSFDPEVGSGNLIQANAPTAEPQTNKIVARRNGLHAYAMVPAKSEATASTDPARNGGGSTGYNEMLQKY